MARSIRMHQAPKERLGKAIDDRRLPLEGSDPSLMLGPRTMLRKQALEMLGPDVDDRRAAVWDTRVCRSAWLLSGWIGNTRPMA